MPVKKNWLELLQNQCLEDKAEILTVNNLNITECKKINREMRCKFICNCGEEGEKTIRRIQETGTCCKKCTDKKKVCKRKETNIKKYGVANGHCQEVLKKIKQTSLNKYGVEHYNQLKEIREKMASRINTVDWLSLLKIKSIEDEATDITINSKKINEYKKINNREMLCKFICKCGIHCSKNTRMVIEVSGFKCKKCTELEKQEKTKKECLKKYGVDHPHKFKEVRDKSRSTMLKKIGVEYPGQSKKIRDKKEVTNLKKYGVKHAFLNDKIKKNIQNTIKLKYGVENVSQSEIIKERKCQTSIRNYGVEHPMHNKDFFEKQQKKLHKYKEYTFTTGEIDICQGYEHWSLRELEEECGYTYEDYQNWNGLEFWYEYKKKKHRYYPDIPFLRENLIIEVKSDYTFYKQLARNLMKAKCVITNEKGFEFWIYDNKCNKTVLGNEFISNKHKVNKEIIDQYSLNK